MEGGWKGAGNGREPSSRHAHMQEMRALHRPRPSTHRPVALQSACSQAPAGCSCSSSPHAVTLPLCRPPAVRSASEWISVIAAATPPGRELLPTSRPTLLTAASCPRSIITQLRPAPKGEAGSTGSATHEARLPSTRASAGATPALLSSTCRSCVQLRLPPSSAAAKTAVQGSGGAGGGEGEKWRAGAAVPRPRRRATQRRPRRSSNAGWHAPPAKMPRRSRERRGRLGCKRDDVRALARAAACRRCGRPDHMQERARGVVQAGLARSGLGLQA